MKKIRCARCLLKMKVKASAYCRDCNKVRCKEWYLKNRKEKLAKTKEWQIKNNYKSQKTPEQRALRNIKRETRRLYPLKNKNCNFCGKQATEHHHFTNPIQVDKFVYVCHQCHINNYKGVIRKWHGEKRRN